MAGTVNERRRSPRWPAAAFPWTRVRLRPGRDASLVNLASGGMLVEGAARLHPGSAVVLQLIGPSSSPLISGKVLRCQVAALERDAAVRYAGAISFDAAIDLESVDASNE
jgi:hypothetical protein